MIYDISLPVPPQFWRERLSSPFDSKYKPGNTTLRWPEVIVASSRILCHWEERRAPFSRWTTILPYKYHLQKSTLQDQKCQIHPDWFVHFFIFIFFRVWCSNPSVHNSNIHIWGLIHHCHFSKTHSAWVPVTFLWTYEITRTVYNINDTSILIYGKT